MLGMTECLGFLGPSVIVLPAVGEDQREILCQSSEGKKHRRNIPGFSCLASTPAAAHRTEMNSLKEDNLIQALQSLINLHYFPSFHVIIWIALLFS